MQGSPWAHRWSTFVHCWRRTNGTGIVAKSSILCASDHPILTKKKISTPQNKKLTLSCSYFDNPRQGVPCALRFLFTNVIHPSIQLQHGQARSGIWWYSRSSTWIMQGTWTCCLRTCWRRVYIGGDQMGMHGMQTMRRVSISAASSNSRHLNTTIFTNHLGLRRIKAFIHFAGICRSQRWENWSVR